MERELYDMASKLPEMERTFADVQSRAPKKTQRNIWRRVAAVATCFFLMAGVGLGTYAYTAEVKEYNAAVRFFCEYDLPTEGLTRGDIKAVYRDISTQTFHYSITEEVIENSLTPEQKTEYKELKDDQNAGNAADLWEYKTQNASGEPSTEPTQTAQTTQPTQPILQTVSQSGMTFKVLPEHPGGYTVTTSEKNISGEVVIPATVNGLPVVAINASAFYEREKLTGVTVPDSVTYIGDYAFAGCTKLARISLSNNLAFLGRDTLRGAKLEYNQYDNAFYLGSATNPYVVLTGAVSAHISQCQIHPDTKFICGGAFCRCDKLTEIAIPEGVLGLGRGVFLECSNLSRVSLPNSLTSVGYQIFSDIGDEPDSSDLYAKIAGLTYNIYDNAMYLGNATNPYVMLMDTVSDDITQCRIHPETKFIYSGAFVKCKVKEIIIPDSVIGVEEAFSSCSALTKITIGKGVTEFSTHNLHCENLETFLVSEDNAYFASDESGVLFNKDMTVLLQAPAKLSGHYAIPDSVTTIKGLAFDQCKKLSEITVGKGVSGIDQYTFPRRADLTVVVADGNPKYKADNAGVIYSVYGKKLVWAPANLAGHYTIPDGVAQLEVMVFYFCDGLESITIPKSIKYLGSDTFSPSGKLKTIYYTGTQKNWDNIQKSASELKSVTVICSDTAETTPVATITPPTESNQRGKTININITPAGAIIAILVLTNIGTVVFFIKKKTPAKPNNVEKSKD